MDAEVLTRDAADEIVCRFPVPPEVIATKSSTGSPDWCYGSARDLRHDHWLVRTGKRRKDGPATVSAEPIVDLGGVTLSPSDNATKKLLMLSWLSGTSGRGKFDARRLVAIANAFDWVVRFRLAIGAARFKAMTRADFTFFLECLEAGRFVGLVPIEQRLAGLAQEAVAPSTLIERGAPVAGLDCPRTPSDAAGRKALARHLGVTVRSLRNHLADMQA